MNKRAVASSAILGLSLLIASCGGAKPRSPAEHGRVVYMTNCVVCHNSNPNLAGTQGPAIAGSPRELLAARVLTLKYPPGYKPKRTTNAMRAFPQIKGKIDDLYAFLQEAAEQNQTAH
ncbi:MAG: c-type cytochrome [Candidatus Binataceae bacterium]